MKKKTYKLSGTLWIYPGDNAAWHFLTIQKKTSREITEAFRGKTRGWGSRPVSVRIGKTTWTTSIFPDRKSETYLLPVKASVRRAEGLFEKDIVQYEITLCP